MKQAAVGLFQINPFVDPEFLAFKALVSLPKRKKAKEDDEEEKKGVEEEVIEEENKDKVEAKVHEIRSHDMVAMVNF